MNTKRNLSTLTNTESQALAAPADPMAALVAELEACCEAVKYCFALAMGPQTGTRDPRAVFSNFTEICEIPDRFRIMNMAISLMEASGQLAESMAKAKAGGELRQSITVERLERFAAAGVAPGETRAKNLRQSGHAAPEIAQQGEGGEAES